MSINNGYENEVKHLSIGNCDDEENVRIHTCSKGISMSGAKKHDEQKKVMVRSGKTTRSVLSDDIYYIESSNRKVILYLQQEKIEYYDKISQLESQLKPDFFRIHKGYLVNMKYVERYDRTEVRMKNGDSLLISKYKYHNFVKSYKEYIDSRNS